LMDIIKYYQLILVCLFAHLVLF